MIQQLQVQMQQSMLAQCKEVIQALSIELEKALKLNQHLQNQCNSLTHSLSKMNNRIEELILQNNILKQQSSKNNFQIYAQLQNDYSYMQNANNINRQFQEQIKILRKQKGDLISVARGKQQKEQQNVQIIKELQFQNNVLRKKIKKLQKQNVEGANNLKILSKNLKKQIKDIDEQNVNILANCTQKKKKKIQDSFQNIQIKEISQFNDQSLQQQAIRGGSPKTKKRNNKQITLKHSPHKANPQLREGIKNIKDLIGQQLMKCQLKKELTFSSNIERTLHEIDSKLFQMSRMAKGSF